MKKDYKKWHQYKSKLHNDVHARPGFHEREIWYCNLGENIGFEQDGKGDQFLRPVIVLRKFNNEVLWIVPLTSAIKVSPYYFILSFGAENRKSSAILSQVRLIDAKRLSYSIGEVSKLIFEDLKKKFRGLIP